METNEKKRSKFKAPYKLLLDIALTVILMFIMAYQVTGDTLHEWLGIGMTALLIVHHILNRKWHGALFKGKYGAYRIISTSVNALLLISILITALCGMSMSGHAVPFMYGLVNVMTARKLHLAFSYWSFILMGIHIGLHLKAMTAILPDKAKLTFNIILTASAGTGLWLFIKSGIIDYILFKTHFAFLDYETAKWLVIAENLAMLTLFALVGYTAVGLIQKGKGKKHLKTHKSQGGETLCR